MKITPRPELRPCVWCFDCGPTFDGWTDDTRWNGFQNVWIDDPTFERICEWMLDVEPGPDGERNAAQMMAGVDTFDAWRDSSRCEDGTISLAYGFTTWVVGYIQYDEPIGPDVRCTAHECLCPECAAALAEMHREIEGYREHATTTADVLDRPAPSCDTVDPLQLLEHDDHDCGGVIMSQSLDVLFAMNDALVVERDTIAATQKPHAWTDEAKAAIEPICAQMRAIGEAIMALRICYRIRRGEH